MEQKQVEGLVAALAGKLEPADFTVDGSILAAALAGTPNPVAIPVNGALIRTSAGFVGQVFAASTVLARGPTGDLTTLSFSAFKTALAIGAADLTLTQNYIYRGDVAGKAAMVQTTDVPLSAWGAPTANIALGGYTFTTTLNYASIPETGFPTKEQIETYVTNAVSTGGGFAAPFHGTLTSGNMVLATLPGTPTDAANVMVYVNGQYLHQGAGRDYTITGAVITATSALNVAWGGTASDGLGFAATDLIAVHYR